MSENPYAAPRDDATIQPVVFLPPLDAATAEDLRAVASNQRTIQLCILVQVVTYLGGIASEMVFDGAWGGLLGLVMIVSALTGAVFAFRLALRVYNVALAIFFGIITFIPCVGLLSLLLINQRAIARLQEFQIPVGFLGANMQSIEERVLGLPPGYLPSGVMIPPPGSMPTDPPL